MPALSARRRGNEAGEHFGAFRPAALNLGCNHLGGVKRLMAPGCDFASGARRRPRDAVFGERAHGGETAVDVGARPTVDRDDPGEHDLVVAVGEPALHPRLARAGAEGSAGANFFEGRVRIVDSQQFIVGSLQLISLKTKG